MAKGQSNTEADKNFEDFRSVNLSVLDHLANKPAVEVLREVEKIGLISKETRKKIEEAVPNHVQLLEDASQPDGVTFINDDAKRAAFKRAFENVYGKFILEEKIVEFEDPNSSVMKVFGKILKFPAKSVNGNSPFDKRSEIQVALSKLSAVVSKKGGRYVHPAAKKIQKEIDDQKNVKIQDQTRIKSEIGKLETGKAALKKRLELCRKNNTAADANIADAKKRIQEIASLETLYSDPYLSGLKFDDELTKVTSISDAGAAYPVLKDFEQKAESLKGFTYFEAASSNYINKFQDLDKRKTGGDNVDAELLSLLNSELVSLLETIRDFTPNFAADRTHWESVETAAATKKSKNVGKIEELTQEIEVIDKNLLSLRDNETTATMEIKNLDKTTVADRLLEKAFPGLRIVDGVIKIRGFETNFEHVKKQMKGASEYFASPEAVPSLRDSYAELKSLQDKTKTADMDQLMIDLKVDKNKPLKAQLQKLRAAYQGKKDNVAKNPTGNDLTRLIQTKLNQTGKGGEKMTEQQAKEAIFEEFDQIRDKQGEEIAKIEGLKEAFEELIKQSEAFYAEFKKLIRHLEIVEKADVKLTKSDGTEVPLKTIVDNFGKINVKATDFNPAKLLNVYEQFGGYFDVDTNLSSIMDRLDEANEDIAGNRPLGDSEAAEKILIAIASEQHPNLSLGDQQKLVKRIMIEDVALLQTQEDYHSLAKRLSSAVLETANVAEFKDKLVDFKYKENGSTVEPFKGLSPDDFSDWSRIEQLFKKGWTDKKSGKFKKLDYKNGFFVLAAFEIFEAQSDDTKENKSLQRRSLEKHLKGMLAKELGVENKMHISGYNKIVDEAFEDQFEEVTPLVEAHFTHFDVNKDDIKSNKIAEVNLRLKILKEKHRRGDLTDGQLEMEMDKLKEDAADSGVESETDLAQDTILAKFKDSEFGKWLDDKTYDTKEYAKGKAGAVGKSALKLTGKAIGGTVKVGASLMWQTSILPVRAAKRAAMIAGRPFIGLVNLFKKQPWQPYSLRQKFAEDIQGVAEYFGGGVRGAWENATTNVKTIPVEEWKSVEYKTNEYKDRSDVKPDELEEKAKKHLEKATFTPVETGDTPFIDLAKYKEKVKQVDKFLEAKAA